MKYLRITPAQPLQGELSFPGDKSITHRALIIGALAKAGSKVKLHNWLQSLDCLATLQVLQAMGVQTTYLDANTLQIESVGLNGLQKTDRVLDVGNSGTAMRLLTGVLCAQQFSSVITGDASIQQRPMHRVIAPLRLMGAKIAAQTSAGQQDEFAPLAITGGQTLRGIDYLMPMASAQVKSALLLAGLYAQGTTNVVSPSTCRDHTEIMLDYFAQASDSEINLHIPGDLSAAAFFLVGACITPGSDLLLRNIGVNPTRIGVLEILHSMGADITILNKSRSNNEWHADLHVRYNGKLTGVKIPPQIIANAIDELPSICLAAACANGVTEIRGAGELRFKESDRIAMMTSGLRKLGIEVNEYSDGLAIIGGVLSGGEVAAAGDHRIAMTFAMAGLVARREIIVQDTANIATSFPNFLQLASKAGMCITEYIPEKISGESLWPI